MEIGNHSWTHADLARMGQATATRELTRTSNAIRRASGQGPFSVRPPYGSFVQATPHTGCPSSCGTWTPRTGRTTAAR